MTTILLVTPKKRMMKTQHDFTVGQRVAIHLHCSLNAYEFNAEGTIVAIHADCPVPLLEVDGFNPHLFFDIEKQELKQQSTPVIFGELELIE